jgi:hypothetical protein
MIIIPLHTVSSQECPTTLLDPRDVFYDRSRLVPLPRLDAERNPRPEQWIFPDLQFTCNGLVTKWIFEAKPRQSAATCGVVFETWRLNTTSSNTTTTYDRISTTQRSRINFVAQEGAIFTYGLASPVVIEPGDIVGVMIRRSCNVLSFNATGIVNDSTSLSYGRDGSNSTFNLDGTTPSQNLSPLIGYQVGELIVKCIINAILPLT